MDNLIGFNFTEKSDSDLFESISRKPITMLIKKNESCLLKVVSKFNSVVMDKISSRGIIISSKDMLDRVSIETCSNPFKNIMKIDGEPVAYMEVSLGETSHLFKNDSLSHSIESSIKYIIFDIEKNKEIQVEGLDL